MDRQLLVKLLVVISFISTLLICSLALADIVLSWGEAELESGIKGPYNLTPLQGQHGVGGNLVQLIRDTLKDGPDPIAWDDVEKKWIPSGDDFLIDATYIGYGSFFPDAGLFNVLSETYGDLAVGDGVFVRAFNGDYPSGSDATHYGNSPLTFEISTDFPNVNEFTDAGGFYTNNPVPEPALMMILLPGLALLIYLTKRKG